MTSTTSALSGCVSSLQSSMDLLNSSLAILDAGVNDFPRLGKVLQTTRHFELLPEASLLSAQASLLSSITPELQSLLARVETYLDRLSRREQALIAKAELQEGRLSSASETPKSSVSRSRPPSRSLTDAEESKEEVGAKEIQKMKMLRQKKERLNFTVERLNLQAKQRERQLRMSMAGPRE